MSILHLPQSLSHNPQPALARTTPLSSHTVPAPQRTMPPRRTSARLARRQGEGDGRAGGTTVPANRKSRGPTKRQQLIMETASQPRLFPMLDDMVSGVVLTYLSSEELGIRWE